jgi:hypothetical protein
MGINLQRFVGKVQDSGKQVATSNKTSMQGQKWSQTRIVKWDEELNVSGRDEMDEMRRQKLDY